MNFSANIQDYATHTEKKREHRDRNVMLQKSVNTNKHNILATIGYEQEWKTKHRNQTKYQPITVAARSKARTVFVRDSDFEFHSRHGCLCSFIPCLCCSVCR
jgi:hypothetical protein